MPLAVSRSILTSNRTAILVDVHADVYLRYSQAVQAGVLPVRLALARHGVLPMYCERSFLTIERITGTEAPLATRGHRVQGSKIPASDFSTHTNSAPLFPASVQPTPITAYSGGFESPLTLPADVALKILLISSENYKRQWPRTTGRAPSSRPGSPL